MLLNEYMINLKQFVLYGKKKNGCPCLLMHRLLRVRKGIKIRCAAINYLTHYLYILPQTWILLTLRHANGF